MDAFSYTVFGGKHLDLSSMGYLHHDLAVILWKRLLPGLPIKSHVSMVSCTLVKFESNTMGLGRKRGLSVLKV
jgi:hypothetical protein